MRKTAIFIMLLATGAFIANAQNETRTQSPSKTQNGTKSSSSTGQSTTNSRDVNSGSSTSTESMRGTRLQISDLPKVVSEDISSKYKGWTPQEVYKVDHEGATAYEVVVKKNEEQKSLVYDAKGNLLRTEEHTGMGTSGSSTGSGSSTSPTETR